jgi:hypothetical protein
MMKDRSRNLKLARILEDEGLIKTAQPKTASDPDPIGDLEDVILGALYKVSLKADGSYEKVQINNLAHILKWDKWRASQARYHKPKDVLPNDPAIRRAISSYRKLVEMLESTPPGVRDDYFWSSLEQKAARAGSKLGTPSAPPRDFGWDFDEGRKPYKW